MKYLQYLMYNCLWGSEYIEMYWVTRCVRVGMSVVLSWNNARQVSTARNLNRDGENCLISTQPFDSVCVSNVARTPIKIEFILYYEAPRRSFRLPPRQQRLLLSLFCAGLTDSQATPKEVIALGFAVLRIGRG